MKFLIPELERFDLYSKLYDLYHGLIPYHQIFIDGKNKNGIDIAYNAPSIAYAILEDRYDIFLFNGVSASKWEETHPVDFYKLLHSLMVINITIDRNIWNPEEELKRILRKKTEMIEEYSMHERYIKRVNSNLHFKG